MGFTENTDVIATSKELKSKIFQMKWKMTSIIRIDCAYGLVVKLSSGDSFEQNWLQLNVNSRQIFKKNEYCQLTASRAVSWLDEHREPVLISKLHGMTPSAKESSTWWWALSTCKIEGPIQRAVCRVSKATHHQNWLSLCNSKARQRKRWFRCLLDRSCHSEPPTDHRAGL